MPFDGSIKKKFLKVKKIRRLTCWRFIIGYECSKKNEWMTTIDHGTVKALAAALQWGTALGPAVGPSITPFRSYIRTRTKCRKTLVRNGILWKPDMNKRLRPNWTPFTCPPFTCLAFQFSFRWCSVYIMEARERVCMGARLYSYNYKIDWSGLCVQHSTVLWNYIIRS